MEEEEEEEEKEEEEKEEFSQRSLGAPQLYKKHEPCSASRCCLW